MKKLLSILLSFVMIFSILPAAIFAEDVEIIDKVEVEVTEPKVGEVPSAPAIKTPNVDFIPNLIGDLGYKPYDYTWCEYDKQDSYVFEADKMLAPGDTFKAGKVYVLDFDLIVEKNSDIKYELAPKVPVTLNGKNDFYECIHYTNNEQLSIVYIFDLTETDVATEINEINIEVEEPVVGAKPSIPKILTDSVLFNDGVGEYYEGIGYGWVEIDETGYWITPDLPDDYVFEAGKFYTLNIEMIPADGFVFADDIVFKINGKTSSNKYDEVTDDFIDAYFDYAMPKAHSITVEEAENGKITADKASAIEGEKVTLTATPDKGYKLSYFEVNGKKISGKTFKMPAEDVTITAVFKKITSSGSGSVAPSAPAPDYEIEVVYPEVVAPGASTTNPATGDSFFAHIFSFLFR